MNKIKKLDNNIKKKKLKNWKVNTKKKINNKTFNLNKDKTLSVLKKKSSLKMESLNYDWINSLTNELKSRENEIWNLNQRINLYDVKNENYNLNSDNKQTGLSNNIKLDLKNFFKSNKNTKTNDNLYKLKSDDKEEIIYKLRNKLKLKKIKIKELKKSNNNYKDIENNYKNKIYLLINENKNLKEKIFNNTHKYNNFNNSNNNYKNSNNSKKIQLLKKKNEKIYNENNELKIKNRYLNDSLNKLDSFINVFKSNSEIDYKNQKTLENNYEEKIKKWGFLIRIKE